MFTLDEVDEHLQIPDLGFELVHQLLFDPGRVHDLSDGGVDPLPELLRGQVPDVLVQVHVQLFNQLIDDDLRHIKSNNHSLFEL